MKLDTPTSLNPWLLATLTMMSIPTAWAAPTDLSFECHEMMQVDSAIEVTLDLKGMLTSEDPGVSSKQALFLASVSGQAKIRKFSSLAVTHGNFDAELGESKRETLRPGFGDPERVVFKAKSNQHGLLAWGEIRVSELGLGLKSNFESWIKLETQSGEIELRPISCNVSGR
ncbi:hypothetical protein WDW37_00340 [Bdellovibrionota bacterium FG-1]